MTEITIGPAKPDDIPAMSEMLAEMDRFYGSASTNPEDVREQQIRGALFGETPAGHALLARHDEELVGLAAYSFLWPAVGLTRSLYLKELYVVEAYQRRGVGRLFMAALYQIAAEHECSRVEWTTDADNTRAMAFYAGLGVPVETSKVFYRAENNGDKFGPLG
jgi:GNAT superfamily N-acetyltransferase